MTYICKVLIYKKFQKMEKENKRIKNDYFTPSQILERNPKIANLYTAQGLGYLRKNKVVDGKKLPRGCLISEQSLYDFLKWRFGFEPE